MQDSLFVYQIQTEGRNNNGFDENDSRAVRGIRCDGE